MHCGATTLANVNVSGGCGYRQRTSSWLGGGLKTRHGGALGIVHKVTQNLQSTAKQLKSDCDSTTKPLELYKDGVKRTYGNQVPGAPLP
jgi:hypothetical protein